VDIYRENILIWGKMTQVSIVAHGSIVSFEAKDIDRTECVKILAKNQVQATKWCYIKG
jgi:hypothetical protein